VSSGAVLLDWAAAAAGRREPARCWFSNKSSSQSQTNHWFTQCGTGSCSQSAQQFKCTT